ncbi:uncharacterized protein RCC_09612 [Ramularia collo-cygni]|uniref:Transcription initiation factor TFIID subunit 4 n=1 Tax=Ramularia collo-cygni TaxID=112498 RepID=A0A2D3V0P7_9PEZI|nr:uncharacterized protein RCC_09612 [Ramularia collo-cygni]CZT23897.1 uncharacterized protein RCC_09612 [Ramularia collo-cygni]
MSYSHMSPPVPALKPPSPYPPYSPNNAASPTAQSPYAPPPAKRQRLSPGPGPMSPPNGSPAYAHAPHGLPNGSSYGNPYANQPVQSPYSPASYAGSPQNSFNTPQPYQAPQQQMQWQQPQGQGQLQQRPAQTSPGPPNGAGMMPPPPRPNKEDRDEKVGVEDIGDSLFGSGINLKDEENYLHNTWNNRLGNESFGTVQSTSFGSSNMSPNGSFNMLTQSTSFGSQGQNPAFAGTLSQPRSQEQIEAELRQKREAAARKLAEFQQHHLNNQFLSGNCLRHRLHKRATENSVRLDTTGVYVRNPQVQPKVRVALDGNANEGIVEAKAESMIEAGVNYEQILSLISLATGERLRGLMSDAFGLARARRYGDHGRVVPPEFADIAVGQGEMSQDSVVRENVTDSQWEQTGELPDGSGDAATHSEKESSLTVQTVAFPGTINAHLRELASIDKQAEKERARKREARRRKLAAEGGDEGLPADLAAEMLAQAQAAPAKMTKKELNKKAKENSTEAQGVKQSNQTAALALGKKNRNKYSWMTGGAAEVPVNRFAKDTKSSTPASGTATPMVDAGSATSLPVAAPKAEKMPTWGDWREDNINGKAIQLRDWIRILDRDGKEKKALQSALNKLS